MHSGQQIRRHGRRPAVPTETETVGDKPHEWKNETSRLCRFVRACGLINAVVKFGRSLQHPKYGRQSRKSTNLGISLADLQEYASIKHLKLALHNRAEPHV